MSVHVEPDPTRQSLERVTEPDERQSATSWTHGRSWTSEETDYLLEHLSTQTVSTIAKRLGRSDMAVRHKLRSLGISYQDLAGFKSKDLAGMLQVTVRQVRRWRRKGYLQSVNGRITEESFARFCKCHAEKIPYDQLDDCVQLWLRAYGYVDAKRQNQEKEAVVSGSPDSAC